MNKLRVHQGAKKLRWGVVGRLLGLSFVICHLLFSASACSSISCPVDNIVATNYVICDADGNEASIVDTLWIWSERSDGSDTLLLNGLTGQSSFSLPISYSHPEDVLVLLKADTAGYYTLDTLWLKKDDIPHFESVDCPAHFFHRLTAVRHTSGGIDSVKIVNSFVDYDQNKTHLNIYLSGLGAQ